MAPSRISEVLGYSGILAAAANLLPLQRCKSHRGKLIAFPD